MSSTLRPAQNPTPDTASDPASTPTPDPAQNLNRLGLTDVAAAVDAYLADFLDHRPLTPSLTDAVRYAILGTGKRVRPVLTVWSCLAVGGRLDDAIAPAAAIELIHCFSLVHDDLPAMDDDDLRRGRPTLHRHTSEAMAILGGDAMIGLAFELIATRIESPQLARRITLELATATNDMIAGQVYDTLPDDCGLAADLKPIDRLRMIHRHKTGALIRCSCRMGGLSGGGDDRELIALTRYAENIGLMFQVVDDVLDVTQTTETLGKTANKDAEQGKLTYPGLLGLDQSKDEIFRLRTLAHQALAPLGDRADRLRELCDYIAVREH